MRMITKPSLQIRQGMLAGLSVATVTLTIISIVNGFTVREIISVAIGDLIILACLYFILSTIDRRRQQREY